MTTTPLSRFREGCADDITTEFRTNRAFLADMKPVYAKVFGQEVGSNDFTPDVDDGRLRNIIGTAVEWEANPFQTMWKSVYGPVSREVAVEEWLNYAQDDLNFRSDDKKEQEQRKKNLEYVANVYRKLVWEVETQTDFDDAHKLYEQIRTELKRYEEEPEGKEKRTPLKTKQRGKNKPADEPPRASDSGAATSSAMSVEARDWLTKANEFTDKWSRETIAEIVFDSKHPEAWMERITQQEFDVQRHLEKFEETWREGLLDTDANALQEAREALQETQTAFDARAKYLHALLQDHLKKLKSAEQLRQAAAAHAARKDADRRSPNPGTPHDPGVRGEDDPEAPTPRGERKEQANAADDATKSAQKLGGGLPFSESGTAPGQGLQGPTPTPLGGGGNAPPTPPSQPFSGASFTGGEGGTPTPLAPAAASGGAPASQPGAPMDETEVRQRLLSVWEKLSELETKLGTPPDISALEPLVRAFGYTGAVTGTDLREFLTDQTKPFHELVLQSDLDALRRELDELREQIPEEVPEPSGAARARPHVRKPDEGAARGRGTVPTKTGADVARARMDRLERTLLDLRERVNEEPTRREVDEIRREIHTLRARTRSSPDVTALRAEVDKLRRAIPSGSSGITALRAEVEQLRRAIPSAPVAPVSSSSGVTALRTEAERQRARLAAMELQLRALQQATPPPAGGGGSNSSALLRAEAERQRARLAAIELQLSALQRTAPAAPDAELRTAVRALEKTVRTMREEAPDTATMRTRLEQMRARLDALEARPRKVIKTSTKAVHREMDRLRALMRDPTRTDKDQKRVLEALEKQVRALARTDNAPVAVHRIEKHIHRLRDGSGDDTDALDKLSADIEALDVSQVLEELRDDVEALQARVKRLEAPDEKRPEVPGETRPAAPDEKRVDAPDATLAAQVRALTTRVDYIQAHCCGGGDDGSRAVPSACAETPPYRGEPHAFVGKGKSTTQGADRCLTTCPVTRRPDGALACDGKGSSFGVRKIRATVPTDDKQGEHEVIFYEPCCFTAAQRAAAGGDGAFIRSEREWLAEQKRYGAAGGNEPFRATTWDDLHRFAGPRKNYAGDHKRHNKLMVRVGKQ